MAEKVLTVGNVEFERGHPSDFQDRFASGIQLARYDYYRKVFDRRSPEQVQRFVSRLTLENWSDPDASVGTTGRTGQRRFDPIAVLATNLRTGKVKGLWYAAGNVSSKAERVLNRLHVPARITTPIGEWEREKKMDAGRYYVWSSECVHDDELLALPLTLGTLALGHYDDELAGTFFPWDEETTLKAQLTNWGYRWDGDKPYLIKGPKTFGAGAPDTNQERWVVPRIGDAVEAMAAEALGE